jgi:hypothetical protein
MPHLQRCWTCVCSSTKYTYSRSNIVTFWWHIETNPCL